MKLEKILPKNSKRREIALKIYNKYLKKFDKFARKKMQKLLEQNSAFKQVIDSYKERCESLEQELSQLREERVKECEEISQTISEYKYAIQSAKQIVTDYQKIMNDALQLKSKYMKEFLEFKKTWTQ